MNQEVVFSRLSTGALNSLGLGSAFIIILLFMLGLSIYYSYVR
jgi:hypothetical protein